MTFWKRHVTQVTGDPLISFFTSCPRQQHTTTAEQHRDTTMELCVKTFDDETYVIEVGVDDTAAVMRRKVASAVGLPEDGFHMRFGGETLGEEADMAQLSVGDTIELTKTERYDIVAALHALGETDITAERLGSVVDPEVASLLLQAEVATVIPNNFLTSGSFTELDLSVELAVTEVGDSFLETCKELTRIDLSGLCNVTVIGGCFLGECHSLPTIDLSPLCKVNQIGEGFLYECRLLPTIDLSPLRNVKHVGEGFLYECLSLTTIDLSALCNVTEIDDSFITDCTSLTSVDLSGLRNVKKIGDLFFATCASLETIDLSPLCNVTEIGICFLTDCTSLTTIELSGCNEYLSTTLKEQKHMKDMRFS